MKEKLLAILFVIICCSLGCASFATDSYSYRVSGVTASAESVIRASSDARVASMHSTVEIEEQRARIELGKKCYEDYGPICASLGFSVGYYGMNGMAYAGGFYAPYDYTTLGLLAAGAAKSPEATSPETTTAAKEAQEKANRSIKEVNDLLEEISKE